MAKELARTGKTSLIAKMAAEHSVEAADFYEAVTETMFKGANKAQLMTLLMVADRYHLDPSTREIFAFKGQTGGIVPVVSIDGWLRLAHQHPEYDGEEIRWAEKRVVPDGGKPCPEWCEILVYRKDTSHPTVIREYLDEVYRKTGPWQSHTKRMLRHKTMIQGYRVAFGFSGIRDEDEAERIAIEQPAQEGFVMPSTNAEKARMALGKASTPEEPSEVAESPAEGQGDTVFEPVDVDGTVTAVVIETDEGEMVVVESVTGEIIEEEDHGTEVVDIGSPQPKTRGFEDVVESAKAALDAVEEPEEKTVARATRKQIEALSAAKKRGNWDDALFARLLKEEYGVTRAADLDREQAIDMIRHLLAGAPDDGQEGLDV